MRLKDVVTESRRASAESVLRYVKRQHHDFRMDSEILKYPHWQLRTVSLDQLNLYNVERDDPLNRVLDIDSEHIETLRREGPAGIQSRPIVVNASGEIIDGNHRAIAAQEMGMESIPAWQPMAKNITEVFVRPGQLTKSYSAKQMVDLGIKPRRGGYYVSARDWADIVSIETGRETIEQVLARRQGLAEGKEAYPEVLYHGSTQEIKGPLTPRQANDIGGHPDSNKNAIYATDDPNFAIAYGLAERGSDTGDRKSTRLNSSHSQQSRMPSSA